MIRRRRFEAPGLERRSRTEWLGRLGEYNLLPAFIFEVVATFLFLVCILGVTQMFKPGDVLAADNA